MKKYCVWPERLFIIKPVKGYSIDHNSISI